MEDTDLFIQVGGGRLTGKIRYCSKENRKHMS